MHGLSAPLHAALLLKSYMVQLDARYLHTTPRITHMYHEFILHTMSCAHAMPRVTL